MLWFPCSQYAVRSGAFCTTCGEVGMQCESGVARALTGYWLVEADDGQLSTVACADGYCVDGHCAAGRDQAADNWMCGT